MATPIGNLSDISDRAVRTLQEADFIAAEDTRVTRKLLAHLGIKKPLISYRAHNHRRAGEIVLSRVLAGESCAAVTDAGMPAVSDPGGDLVRLFADAGMPVIVIPGPCAAIAALAASGFPAGRFVFEGFLPPARNKRLAQLRQLEHEQRTMIFYEAPHRLLQTLGDMQEIFGGRHISVSREMTKIYEETLRFPLPEAISYFEANAPRGEFTVVVKGADPAVSDADSLCKAAAKAQKLISSGMTVRDAVKKAAIETGCSKNVLYAKIGVSKN